VTAAAPRRQVATGDTIAAEDESATKVLMSLQRLAQQATLYDDHNQAQKMALEGTARAAAEYGAATGRNITIFFSERAVYVGKRLLRANRSVYAAANQMKEMLARMGVSQITIGHDVPIEELRILQGRFAQIQKTKGVVPAPTDLTRIRLRVGRAPGDYAEFDRLSPDERAVKVYALAIVIVRRFFEQLQRGQWEITSHLRRISEELISLAEQATPAQLASTVCRPPHDDAERAVSAAILALAMGHQLTKDQRLLRWLATAALLCDVGKPRVAGLNPDASRRAGLRMPTLGLDQFKELPGATAFVTTALGRLTDAGMMRSVLVYEALHIEHGEETGAIYGGERGPAMLSRLIACARRFQLGLSVGKAPGDVVAALVKKSDGLVDRWIVQLMMATLCVVPTGTIVELEDGRVARVMSPPTQRIDFGRPLVRILDAEGAFIDLNAPSRDGKDKPQIARILAASDEDHELRAAFDDSAPVAPAVEEIAGEALGVNEDEELEWSLEDEDDARREASAAHDLLAEGDEWIPEIEGPSPYPDDDLYERLASDEAPPSSDGILSPFAHPPVSDLPPDSRPDAFAGESAAIIRPMSRPIAQGAFGKTPLMHLLIYALDKGLTGTLLIVESDRRQSAIRLEDGKPSKVKSAALISPLDRTIVAMGLLDEEILNRTLRRAHRRGRLHGQQLVDDGLLEPEALEAALQQQLINKIGHLMQLAPTTRYGYYDDVDLLADYGGAATTPCDPYPLIMMGARKYVSWEILDEVLPRVANVPLTLHPEATPERLGLKKTERKALDVMLSEPMTLNDLLLTEGVDEEAAQRLVYALVVTRSIALGEGKKRPVGV